MTALFVIAQGRTGSTLLYRALNSVPGLVGYLEPLHQQFESLADSPRCATYRRVDREQLLSAHGKARRALSRHADLESGWLPIVEYFELLSTNSGDDLPFFQINRLWGPRLGRVIEATPGAIVHFHYREDGEAQRASYDRVFRKPDYFGEFSSWLRRDAEITRLRGAERFAAVRGRCIADTVPRARLVTTYEELQDDPVGTFTKILGLIGLESRADECADLAGVMPRGAD